MNKPRSKLSIYWDRVKRRAYHGKPGTLLRRCWNTALWRPKARVWTLPAAVDFKRFSSLETERLPFTHFVSERGGWFHPVFNSVKYIGENGIVLDKDVDVNEIHFTQTLSPPNYWLFETEDKTYILVDKGMAMLPDIWKGNEPRTVVTRYQILLGDELGMTLTASQDDCMPALMEDGSDSKEFLAKLGIRVVKEGWDDYSQMGAYLRGHKAYRLNKSLVWVEYGYEKFGEEFNDRLWRFAVFVDGKHTFDVVRIGWDTKVFIDPNPTKKVKML